MAIPSWCSATPAQGLQGGDVSLKIDSEAQQPAIVIADMGKNIERRRRAGATWIVPKRELNTRRSHQGPGPPQHTDDQNNRMLHFPPLSELTAAKHGTSASGDNRALGLRLATKRSCPHCSLV